jgi:hypothetical protein
MAAQNLSGTITQDRVLSQDIYIVTANLTINSGVTVNVDAGSVLMMSSNISLTVNGTLIMNGTEENRVVITSTSDPNYGGSGNTLYWNTITIGSNGTFSAKYTDIKYGGTNAVPYRMIVSNRKGRYRKCFYN